MNRRGFFKILVGVVIAPFALPKAKPKLKLNKQQVIICNGLDKKLRWKNYHAIHRVNVAKYRQLKEQLRKAFDGQYFTKPYEAATSNRS